jgi:hypothetical protein
MPNEQCPHNPTVTCTTEKISKKCCKNCWVYKNKIKKAKQMRRTRIKREKERKKKNE